MIFIMHVTHISREKDKYKQHLFSLSVTDNTISIFPIALLVIPTSLIVVAVLALVTQTMLWDAGSISLQKAIKLF